MVWELAPSKQHTNEGQVGWLGGKWWGIWVCLGFSGCGIGGVVVDLLIDLLTALRHISTERLLVPRNVAK